MSDMPNLLKGTSSRFSVFDILFASQKGLIASEISMKRQDLGLTQADLAAKLGVTQSMVSRWEKGETNFTLDTLCRIADALDIQMQSPFALRPRQAYYRDAGKVIPFPGKWNQSYGTNNKYVSPQLEEM